MFNPSYFFRYKTGLRENYEKTAQYTKIRNVAETGQMRTFRGFVPNPIRNIYT